MGLKFHRHGTELYCEYVDPSICYGGGESSGSSQSQGYGSSYQQSASLSLPEEMNPTTGNLGNTEGALQSIYQMLAGGPDGNSILQSFLAPYGGQMVAPVTGAQNQTLNDLGAAETGNFGAFDPSLQAIYQQLINEGVNPIGFGQQIAGGLGLGSNPVQAGQTLAGGAYGGATSAAQAGQELASGLAGPGSPTVGAGQFASNLATGGAIQQVIQGALAPIETQFNTQTIPGLQGSFAQAGQRGSGMGSSAFGMAGANAQAQELATEAGTASGIENNAFEAALNDYATTYGQGASGFANLYGTGANNYANLYGTGVNAGLGAPAQISSLTGNEINQLITTLNAQALPQLTQQLGINNALSTYNGSISSILQALGLQVQAEQPAIGYESETASNSASFQNESSSGQNQSFQFQI